MPGDLISREALERIIQRAAELQAAERDIGDGLTEQEVLALGQDVGIPAPYLKRALLAEQTRSAVREVHGVAGWLAGPALLAAERVVTGEAAAVDRALTVWMEREESLQLKRRHSDRTTWEPRVGAFASIQRALGAGGKSFALARATEIATRVAPLEPGFCHVRLVANVRGPRAQRLWTAVGLGAMGVALAAVVPALGALAPWALVPAVATWGAAVAVARRHRAENERIDVALEQVLDRLERGEIRPEHQFAEPRVSALVRLAVEIRTLMKPGAPPRG